MSESGEPTLSQLKTSKKMNKKYKLLCNKLVLWFLVCNMYIFALDTLVTSTNPITSHPANNTLNNDENDNTAKPKSSQHCNSPSASQGWLS